MTSKIECSVLVFHPSSFFPAIWLMSPYSYTRRREKEERSKGLNEHTVEMGIGMEWR